MIETLESMSTFVRMICVVVCSQGVLYCSYSAVFCGGGVVLFLDMFFDPLVSMGDEYFQ